MQVLQTAPELCVEYNVLPECSDLAANIGDPCDDGDPCTINDVVSFRL